MIISLPVFINKNFSNESVRDLLETLPGGIATFAAVVLMCMYDKNLNKPYQFRSLEEEESFIKDRFLTMAKLLVTDHEDTSYVDETENNMLGYERYNDCHLNSFLDTFFDKHKECYESLLGDIQKQNITRIFPNKINQSKVFIRL